MTYFDQLEGEPLVKYLVDLRSSRQLPLTDYVRPSTCNTVLKIVAKTLHQPVRRGGGGGGGGEELEIL